MARASNVQRAWQQMREEAAHCTRCDLYKCATQTVFGEGPLNAKILFVGEQPGDQEDLAGRPFVGPAGQLFDAALEEAGIDRARTYVTNAVKHFKWKPQGKRRKHQKPLMSEVTACKPWMEAELDVVRPKILVCLGATAAQSVLGKGVLITQERGKFIDGPSGRLTFITIHPSSIYRHPDKEEQEKEYRRFASDLKLVQRKLTTLKAA